MCLSFELNFTCVGRYTQNRQRTGADLIASSMLSSSRIRQEPLNKPNPHRKNE